MQINLDSMLYRRLSDIIMYDTNNKTKCAIFIKKTNNIYSFDILMVLLCIRVRRRKHIMFTTEIIYITFCN